jgi:hypothetical protein
VEDEEENNQCDEVSYSNVIPYVCTDGEGKLVHV